MADTSPERLEHARRMLRSDRDGLMKLSLGARMTFAVGLLICDDKGHIKKADLTPAMNDPEVRAAAQQLLVETSCMFPGADN